MSIVTKTGDSETTFFRAYDNYLRLMARICGFGILFAATFQIYAQHYPAGSEGILAGSLPPSGFYVKDYNSFYIYGEAPYYFYGRKENSQFTQFDYTQAPRLIWITPLHLLGADFGMAVRIPFVYQQFAHVGDRAVIFGGHFEIATTGNTTERHFGLSDIQIEPIIFSWRLNHFDFDTSASFWAPTGDYNQNEDYAFYNLGQGYWTYSFSLGATWYPDAKKTWAISVLNYYDINTAQSLTEEVLRRDPGLKLGTESFDITPGQIYTLEWGISKTFAKRFDLGLTGYYQEQVTDTRGGPPGQDQWIRVAGIGPEAGVTFPKLGMKTSLRYDYEFSSEDHPQGHLINLTLTKFF